MRNPIQWLDVALLCINDKKIRDIYLEIFTKLLNSYFGLIFN